MDSKNRFSDRVEQYIKYRPAYPDAVISTLQLEIGLMSDDVVADIGSGTGISAQLLLEHGNTVYGVEPNEPMRKASEGLLREYNNFISVHGSSEHTGLKEGSVDVIVCAQAFHWFSPSETKREFQRIAANGAHLVILFNDRSASDPFQQDYEMLIQEFSTDYQLVTHRNISEEMITQFYSPYPFKKWVFPYAQYFDLEGLIGRVVSSSYMPNEDSPDFPPLKNAIEVLFNSHKRNGIITFAYETSLYVGRI